MNPSGSIVILGGARTPMTEWVSGRRGDGKPGGLFAGISAIDLGAIAAKGALEKTGVDPGAIDHVVMGNAMQTSGDALYGARHVALRAGLDHRVPALTVNRICGSGIQSVVSAAQMILTGDATTVIAGGMENLSQSPHVIRGARTGLRMGHQPLEDSLMVSLMDPTCGLLMAQTAEKLAREYKIARSEQDAFALLSHQRAGDAVARGLIADEIVPVAVRAGKTELQVTADDHLKPDSTMEGLSALPAVFSKDGFVTAGNASGVVDGACALVLMESSAARAAGRTPLGRIVGWTTVGVDPSVMGIGPAPAIRALCDRTGVALAAIDRFEINEAFAAQYLAVEKDLGLDRAKVNVQGGAIALGHPLAATGTRLILTVLHQLRSDGLRYGVASACIGGGQGIAILVENPAAA